MISGYARLPDSVANHDRCTRLGVVPAVDTVDGRIITADTTMPIDLAKDFFLALVEGSSMAEDIGAPVQRVQTRYAGQSGARTDHRAVPLHGELLSAAGRRPTARRHRSQGVTTP